MDFFKTLLLIEIRLHAIFAYIFEYNIFNKIDYKLMDDLKRKCILLKVKIIVLF
jgi:hypothetical protein